MKIHPDCGYFNEDKHDEYSPYPGECEDCYRYDVCLEAEIKEKNMNMKEWAKREVEIACKKENLDRRGEFDHGCICYESALKAFNCLMEDNHSGISISFTKNILNRLIDGKCLTPIEDTDDIWKYSFDRSDSAKVYQCKRMSSFFKEVYPDGSTKYNDVDRVVKVDMTTDTIWHSRLIDRIVDEAYPITIPYIPTDGPYKVYCEDFLTDPKNGDYDTVGVLYGIDPDGDRFEINRYFKDGDQDMIEINEGEYEARKLLDKERRG